MSRKEQLIERAARFSDKMQRKDGATHPRADIWDNAHDGYVAGYKAAMRDVRKTMAENRKFVADHPQRRLEDFYLRIYRLVRPLR